MHPIYYLSLYASGQTHKQTYRHAPLLYGIHVLIFDDRVMGIIPKVYMYIPDRICYGIYIT